MRQTLELAVLGDPVEHSLSPAIHGAAMASCGFDGSYTAIKADRRILASMIDGLRSGSMSGLNVTMPLKGDAAELADVLTPEAVSSQSVNTLRSRGNRVEGHSTDAVALAKLISENSIGDQTPIHLLGAGGAAGAVFAAGGDRTIYVASRRMEQAKSIAGQWRQGQTVRWGTPVAGALVINTTPLGMRGENLPEGLIDVASALIDLPYGNATTPAVALALSMGLPTVDGLAFLVTQAAESFRWWTGVDPPLNVMFEAVRKT
jgi:shikimate dehydrogenase